MPALFCRLDAAGDTVKSMISPGSPRGDPSSARAACMLSAGPKDKGAKATGNLEPPRDVPVLVFWQSGLSLLDVRQARALLRRACGKQLPRVVDKDKSP